MSPFRRSKEQPSPPYFSEGPHWDVEPVRDLKAFFGNLLRLLPGGGILCLAKGEWSEEGIRFLRAHAIPSGGLHPLPNEFDEAPHILIDTDRMARLADMVQRHAEPELSMHIRAYANGVAVLEWYDLPEDLITVSLSVPEERVVDFAAACGVGYRAAGTDPNQDRRPRC